METIDQHMAQSSGSSPLSISGEAANYLKEIGGWSFFLAIVGFVFVGFCVVFAFFAGAIFSAAGQATGQEMPFPGGGMFLGAIYFFVAAFYFFPVYFLFRFATGVKKALALKDNTALTTALEHLKSHYKFIGILMIVILGLYALIFVGALIGGALF